MTYYYFTEEVVSYLEMLDIDLSKNIILKIELNPNKFKEGNYNVITLVVSDSEQIQMYFGLEYDRDKDKIEIYEIYQITVDDYLDNYLKKQSI